MLNKELLLSGAKEDDSPVVIDAKNGIFSFNSFKRNGIGYSYDLDNPIGKLSKVPVFYLDGVEATLTSIWYDLDKYDSKMVLDRPVSAKITVKVGYLGSEEYGNPFDFLYEKNQTSATAFGCLFFREGKFLLIFDPPPSDTSIHNSHEASMEESVDDKQGITDDEWRFRRIGECYYTVSSIKTIHRACSEKCRYRQNLFERRLRDFIQRDLEFKSTCRYESKGGSYGWTYQCASNVPTLDKYRSNYRSSNNCGYSRSRSLCRNRNHTVISKEAIYA